MLILSEAQIRSFYGIREALRDLLPALEAQQAGQVQNPPRLVLESPGQASTLYMPSAIGELGALGSKGALDNKGVLGSKVVSVFPQNPAQGRPTTQAVTLLTDAATGEHTALLNASHLTRLRTGALTGIAADHLARPDAGRLGVIGTGGMAPDQIRGVAAVRELRELRLFNLSADKAQQLAEALRPELPGTEILVAPSAEALVEASDMVVTATQSRTPVFDGAALQPGTFLSGIGSYLPSMREVDLVTVQRADKIVLDTLEGPRHEAGELIYAQEQGLWSFEQVHSDLAGVACGTRPGRETADEIIFFKCVGAAYFDLAVALGAYQEAQRRGLGTLAEV
ncbi:ornithine cyclodeaminase family protein [Deinococcus sp. Marseille-Q6407]|uniref:ornithine cyclodeaminase family protein n=1 Tax=Deinococcus sp. Marseille-Q6407 TaxID=2969223 RepID=UPI0021C213EC|nr:ornithine cyclodeaminase family protein [Deinococcus sp. Marseille-Q6407]